MLQISPEEFSHGKTRNYAVQKAKGEYIVMTVQDAQPVSNTWLEQMLQHFNNKQVVGVCGQQAVPHDKDKNPLQWHRPINKSKYYIKHFTHKEFQQLLPKEKWNNCSWDNVNAMYRKSALEKTPFANVKFGEDMIWAKQAFENEQILVYDFRSSVWHYHHYTNKSKLTERIVNTYMLAYQTFNYIKPSSYGLKELLRILYLCAKYRVKPYWWFYNFRLNIWAYFAVRKIIKILKKEK